MREGMEEGRVDEDKHHGCSAIPDLSLAAML